MKHMMSCSVIGAIPVTVSSRSTRDRGDAAVGDRAVKFRGKLPVVVPLQPVVVTETAGQVRNAVDDRLVLVVCRQIHVHRPHRSPAMGVRNTILRRTL